MFRLHSNHYGNVNIADIKSGTISFLGGVEGVGGAGKLYNL